jgi:hypothetical protein
MDSITEYLSKFPHRTKHWFSLLAHNSQTNKNVLAARFLKAELIQSRCPYFKVNP